MPEPEYQIERSDEFDEALGELLPAHLNNVMEFLRDYAQYTPTRTQPKKVVALRGTRKGLFEFKISKKLRLFYWVDEETRTVSLRSIEQHPDWSRSKHGQNL